MKRSIWLVLLLSAYILACSLPVRASGPFSNRAGINCLVLPFVVPFGLIVPFWWANPLFFAGCLALACKRGGLAIGLGLLASVLALSFGLMSGFDGLRSGSLLWMASLFGLVMAGFHEADWADGSGPAKPEGFDELHEADAAWTLGSDHGASSPSGADSSPASSSSAPLSSRSPSYRVGTTSASKPISRR